MNRERAFILLQNIVDMIPNSAFICHWGKDGRKQITGEGGWVGLLV